MHLALDRELNFDTVQMPPVGETRQSDMSFCVGIRQSEGHAMVAAARGFPGSQLIHEGQFIGVRLLCISNTLY